MTKIFVSYRRDDSADISGRIYDRLIAHFGRENVFKDVDSIPFGVNFKTYLDDQVKQCAVLLAVIGKEWLSIADENGTHRLDNPRDFVRIEIESALRREIPVIPLLVQNAAMPDENALPPTLAELTYRNGTAIRRDPDFHTDMDRLIRGLEGWLNPSPSVGTRYIASAPSASPSLRAERGQGGEVNLPPLVLAPKVRPIEWCSIPAGTVSLEDASDWNPPGTKGGTFDVPAFYMAKYPITNAQYQLFVDAKDGYRDAQWWDYSDDAKAWRKKNSKSSDTAYPGDDLPRTNVLWYDAVAFCRWLTAKFDSLPSSPVHGGGAGGGIITLPTEQQWQRAAQGDDNRVYPWGNDFNKSRCNADESGIRQPTPVTQYPNGASPYGVMDMSGNVWEWCLTKWGSENSKLGGNSNRVLRGGSFSSSQASAAASYRYYGFPDYRLDHHGFRVVLAAPI